MSKKTAKYTDGDIGALKIVDDFLPAPHELVKKTETVKITISLNRDSIDFFKDRAKKLKVPYQRMIRALVDEYAEKYSSQK